MIKLIFNETIEFILKLFNSFLYHEYYPEVFKNSQILTICKPGKPKPEVTSYHPFSLTSCLGKILEKIITNRVKDWCNKIIK